MMSIDLNLAVICDKQAEGTSEWICPGTVTIFLIFFTIHRIHSLELRSESPPSIHARSKCVHRIASTQQL